MHFLLFTQFPGHFVQQGPYTSNSSKRSSNVPFIPCGNPPIINSVLQMMQAIHQSTMLSGKEPQKEKIKRAFSSYISTNVPWEVTYRFLLRHSSFIRRHWRELKIPQILPVSWMLHLLISKWSERDVILRMLLVLHSVCLCFYEHT